MTRQSCLVFSGIAPHPPIMVPEVGRESIAGVVDSIDAMSELTKRLIEYLIRGPNSGCREKFAHDVDALG